MLYTSGQIGLVPETGVLAEGGVSAQAEQGMKNLGAVLEAAGMSYENVVKTTLFLADIADFAVVNEIYAKYFTGETPAVPAYRREHYPKARCSRSKPLQWKTNLFDIKKPGTVHCCGSRLFLFPDPSGLHKPRLLLHKLIGYKGRSAGRTIAHAANMMAFPERKKPRPRKQGRIQQRRTHIHERFG